MSAAEAAAPAKIFAALSDPHRLAIVASLSGGERRSIAALASGTRISRQAITKHLGVLESAGLVSHARRGRETQFELQAAPLASARAYLDEVSAQWDTALGRLKAMVEE